MAVRIKDILSLPSLKQMELLSGENGLDNIVTWPYICQMNSFSDWVAGGELVFISGIGINSDEKSLASFVMEGHANKSSGLVFFSDKYIKEIPQKVLDLSNSFALPVFKIPWKAKLIDITREISSFIVSSRSKFDSMYGWAENILFGSEKAVNEAAAKSEQFGFDIGVPHKVAIISSGTRSGQKPETADSRKHLNYFTVAAEETLHKYCSKALCIPHSGSLIAIIPSKDKTDNDIAALLCNVKDSLVSADSKSCFYAGIGRDAENEQSLRKSYLDAERVIKLITSNKLTKNILCYRDIGIYRLFFEIPDKNELAGFYKDKLGPLLDYDRQNRTEFVKTLDVFFENKLNHIKTAQALFIHRNSLIYRLNRIEKILNLKLDDPATLLELQTSILIGRFLSL